MAAMFWWTVFPYVCLTVLIVGLLYRFTFRQTGWIAPSTEIFEKKWLRIGSPLFHWGIVFAFVGHVMGIVLPKGFYDALGITDEMYHIGGIAGGGAAGLMVVTGLVMLMIRKLSVAGVRAHAGFADYFAVGIVLLVSALGAYMTIVYDTTVVAYEYRTTIGPWFRSLFYFAPRSGLMEGVPTLFQVHVIAAFLLFACIPFTKLVHIFSLPARYPTRAPIQYRSRIGYRNRHQQDK